MINNDDILNDCNLNDCNLNDCKIYFDFSNQKLIDIIYEIKADISMKADFYKFEEELVKKDKIINALIGLLIQKEIIKETDIEDYIESEKVIDKLCE